MRTTTLSTLSSANKTIIAGLLAAAAGIVIQIFAGVDYPTIPPGLLILLAAAGVVAFAPWRWVPPVVGLAVPVFLLIGGFQSATFRANLFGPAHFGPFIGSLILLVALLVALFGGVRAIRRRR